MLNVMASKLVRLDELEVIVNLPASAKMKLVSPPDVWSTVKL
jgi:hypothetical protein